MAQQAEIGFELSDVARPRDDRRNRRVGQRELQRRRRERHSASGRLMASRWVPGAW
jgi:hypothetical protein